MRTTVTLAAIGAIAVIGCAKVAGLDAFEIDDCYGGRCDGSPSEENGPDGSHDASPGQDGANEDVAQTDGGQDAGADVGPPPCPGTGGPNGIHIGGSAGAAACVDVTEVTATQYQAFLTAKAGDTSQQDARCAWNKSYAPSVAATGAFPVVGIDWCDAAAFCKWAGKKLCGKIPSGTSSGGALDATNHQNVVQNLWLNACTNGGAMGFPYGAAYEANKCNDYSAGNAVKTVGSVPSCVTPTGALDMVGNVYEWVDYTNVKAGDGSTDDAFIFGGAYGSGGPSTYPPATYSCAVEFQVSRGYAAADVGFRCCSP